MRDSSVKQDCEVEFDAALFQSTKNLGQMRNRSDTTTFGITTFSITIKKRDIQHSDTQHNGIVFVLMVVYAYHQLLVFLIGTNKHFMLSVVILNAVILNVVVPSSHLAKYQRRFLDFKNISISHLEYETVFQIFATVSSISRISMPHRN
jgi:hypothetical protein